MEYFFIDDNFYSDLGDLIDEISEKDDLSDLDDDWSVEATECELQRVIKFSPYWMMDRINTDRFTEDGDEYEKIQEILEKYIDFDRINELIPKLYYPTSDKITLTKQDLLEWLK